MNKFNRMLMLLLIVMFVLAGCRTTKNNPEDLSGSLTLYTSQPEKDAQELIDAFNDTYPNIEVAVFRSGTEEVISKIQAEKSTGTILADVLLVADDATFTQLKQDDLLMAYEPENLDKIDAQFYDADHMYFGTKIITTGIMINRDVISDDIKGYKDLMNGNYTDQIVMPSPLYSGAAAYNLGILTRTDTLGWDFYAALKRANVKIEKGNGAVSKAVIAKERGLGIVVDYLAIRAKQEGANVEFIYPEEGSLIVTEPVGILKSTQNETLAKAFVDFLLSEAGQTKTAEIGYTPIREGVAAPTGFKSASEITVLTTDLQTLVENREADKHEFTKIFE